MKRKLILLFCISFFWYFGLLGQNRKKTALDTIPNVERYGLRVGIDLVKPVRSFLEEGYKGFEISGDFRVSRHFFAAIELGNEQKDWEEPYVSSYTSGGYAKIGFDYNAYENWTGMENAINIGLRYGFSTFSQELTQYRIYTSTTVFPSEVYEVSESFSGLTGHWAELMVGIKTEVLRNLYLSLNLQLKLKLSETEPDNFANLYIPGFNRTYDYSKFGVGYGYSVSYLIPIFKKTRNIQSEK